jgi:hypothetical protein
LALGKAISPGISFGNQVHGLNVLAEQDGIGPVQRERENSVPCPFSKVIPGTSTLPDRGRIQ